jgi:hypothetical protein
MKRAEATSREGDGAGEEIGEGEAAKISLFGDFYSQFIDDQQVRVGIEFPHESPFPHAVSRRRLGKGTEKRNAEGRMKTRR